MKSRKKKRVLSTALPEPNSNINGCLGKIFFDVPVYRLPKAKYEAQQDAYVQKIILVGDRYVQENYRAHPEQKEYMERHLRGSYGGCWLFNEIIGFIRLYFYFPRSAVNIGALT